MSPTPFATIDDVKRAHKGYWFSAGAMEFFGTRFESELIAGRYFVTSEQPPHFPRAYAVREALPDGRVATVGETCEFDTLTDALRRIDQLLEERD